MKLLDLKAKFIKILIVLAIVCSAASSFRYIEKLFYLTPLLFAFLTIAVILEKETRTKFIRGFVLFLPFGLWAALTSLWSLYPIISLTRGIFYILLSAGAVSIVILSIKNFNDIFEAILPLNILIIVSSLISLVTGWPSDAWTGGNTKGFMGFAVHQNTLGALILFTFPAPLYKFLNVLKLKTNTGTSSFHLRPWRTTISPTIIDPSTDGWIPLFNRSIVPLLHLILLSLNLFILFLTHSRASILALLVMVFILNLLTFNKKKVLAVTLLLATVIFLLTSALSGSRPLVADHHFSTSTDKQINLSANKLIVDFLLKGESKFGQNRYPLYEGSYKAALEGGIEGLGYGMSAPDVIVPAAGSYYEGERYVREKGNSFLAIIEEVGIAGIILFVIPIFYIINRSINRATLFSLFIVIGLIIHAQFEAWMVGLNIYTFLFIYYLTGGEREGA